MKLQRLYQARREGQETKQAEVATKRKRRTIYYLTTTTHTRLELARIVVLRYVNIDKRVLGVHSGIQT